MIVTRACPCGAVYRTRTWEAREATVNPDYIVCGACGMDPAAYRYRAIIMELGGAEVYRRETLGLPLR